MAQSIFPVITFRDASAGGQWLANTLGFVPVSMQKDETGIIVHAVTSFQGDALMYSQHVAGSAFSLAPNAVYLVVDDPAEIDALHARATTTGADIVLPPTDQEYGSRDFAVRDPEGNVWCFGTYRPSIAPT